MTKARDIADFKFEDIVDTGTEGTKVASGTTAERGSTAGQIRFNSDTGLAEYYDGTQFKSIDAPPTVSSISPTSLGQSVLGSSQSIVITGSNFSSTITAKIIGDNGTEYTPASTTRDSNTQVTITTPTNLTHTNEPYDIQIQNISGLAGTLAKALSINDTPVFATASGSLGTLADANRASSNLTPISFLDEESTPTLSVTSGSIPAGLTLNSNGTFSGTANAVSSNTTSTFTVTATDGSETATRQYTITVNSPPVVDFLVIAGGGGGNNDTAGWAGGGGGAGGYRNSFNSETSGGGGSSETSLTFNSGTTYTITVGGGGSLANNGSNSSISGLGLTTITSVGGGFSRGEGNGNAGGSGGGGGENSAIGGAGTSNQGFAGGNGTPGSPFCGGGGGGASEVGATSNGSTRANGGDGLYSSITGSSVARAGGGGSGSTSNELWGNGGVGGGGRGAMTTTNTAVAGTVNTGGGGGGGLSRAQDPAKAGGSGVVILRMDTSEYTGTTSGSPTVSTDGTKTILTYTGSGSYTA